MTPSARQKKLAILGILKNETTPTPGKDLAVVLGAQGFEVSDRTVRMYLQELEDEGFLVLSPRKGRTITEAGLRELESEKALSRVGTLSSKINQLIYEMTFDLNLGRGTVIVNVTFVTPKVLGEHLDNLLKVYDQGFAMGRLVGLLAPGAAVNPGTVVPPGRVGLCTVCSVAMNGVFLKHGVPVNNLFSGLLEVRNRVSQRFVEVIHYNGTSIDPLALFIQAGMTDYLGAIATGNGRIGAGYREIPAGSYELVTKLAQRLKAMGLGAVETIGRPGQNVYNIPVNEGACGMVVIGGLNPTAVFEEAGVRVDSRALGGVLEFSELFPYTELPSRLEALVATLDDVGGSPSLPGH